MHTDRWNLTKISPEPGKFSTIRRNQAGGLVTTERARPRARHLDGLHPGLQFGVIEHEVEEEVEIGDCRSDRDRRRRRYGASQRPSPYVKPVVQIPRTINSTALWIRPYATIHMAAGELDTD